MFRKLFWNMLKKDFERSLAKLGLPKATNQVRWYINVGGMKVGFSARLPDSDADMGKVLVSIGNMLQSKRVLIKNLNESSFKTTSTTVNLSINEDENISSIIKEMLKTINLNEFNNKQNRNRK